MTRYYDGEHVAEISMIDKNGVSFESEFFADGMAKYDPAKNWWVVKDVCYLVDYAVDYAAGKNPDFDNFGSDEPACEVAYNIHKVHETENDY